jgi:hypothetical protein
LLSVSPPVRDNTRTSQCVSELTHMWQEHI